MPRRGNRLAYRAAAFCALVGAMVSGASLAVQSHGAARQAQLARRAHAPRPVRGARTIAGAAGRDGGVQAVATVIPPADAATAPSWPPPLLNPRADLRTAWDLALGRPNAREVLFTFDDGPNPGTTDRLLGILDRARIKAVFFVCGWRLMDEEPLRSRARAILRDAFNRGHVIGNHTLHHRNLATLTPEQVRHEIDKNAELIEEVTGQRPHLFRPPYGSYSEDVRDHTEKRHDELALWSVDSHDWQMVGDAQGVAMNVIRLLGNMAGGTVLLHDTHPWSVSAAQMVFRWLETENRDRIAHNRVPYRVVNAADFIEGARARLPLIEAQREEAARAARHARREGASDGGDGGGTGDAGANARAASSTGAAGGTTAAEAHADPRIGAGGGKE